MAKWWKHFTILVVGLVSLTAWLPPASAQGSDSQAPMPSPGYPTSSDPVGMPSTFGSPTGVPQSPQYNQLPVHPPEDPNAFSDEKTYSPPQPYIFKLKGEYLLWHVAMPHLSTTLVTTSTNPNLTNGVGAIGDPGTVSLLGPGDFNYHEISGGRITAGFAPGCFLPIEVGGFWISKSNVSLFNGTSDGSANSPVLSRPFQAINLASLNGLGQQVVLSAGFPSNLAGNINANADMSMWGVETNFFYNVGCSDNVSLDLFLGYRYSDLTENVNISNSVQSVNSAVNISFNSVNTAGFPPGFTTVASDYFRTRNQFNGINFGVRPSLCIGRFSLTSDLKVAVGSTHESVNVSGNSTLISPDGSVQNVPGGLLAVASNSGVTTRNAFTAIPECDLNAGFYLTHNIKLFASYNIFFWSNVVRAGDQLSNRIDSRQVPTDPTFDPTVIGTLPVSPLVSRNFWGQGLSFGVEIGF